MLGLYFTVIPVSILQNALLNKEILEVFGLLSLETNNKHMYQLIFDLLPTWVLSNPLLSNNHHPSMADCFFCPALRPSLTNAPTRLY
jgi:hypothetical protein